MTDREIAVSPDHPETSMKHIVRASVTFNGSGGGVDAFSVALSRSVLAPLVPAEQVSGQIPYGDTSDGSDPLRETRLAEIRAVGEYRKRAFGHGAPGHTSRHRAIPRRPACGVAGHRLDERDVVEVDLASIDRALVEDFLRDELLPID